METHLIGKSERRKRRAVSSVLGGVIIFGMIFTVAFGYFYTISQAQQNLQSAQRQNSNFLSLRNQENLYITTNLIGGNLTFSVNNTGIATDLVAYFISDQTGKVLQEKSGSSLSPPSCSTPASLPCALNAGASVTFTPKTTFVTGSTDTIKVLTNRGTTIVGTYPTQELTSSSLNSFVAAGLGSLQMIFSSFTFYNYSTTSPWKINLTSGDQAAVTPYGKYIAFSAQLVNNDPTAGTIVVDAHTDLWTFLSCGSGCGSQSLLAFYVMNVGSDGTVTSATSGSYVPVQIPYGSSKTVYFGSNCDLSLSSCSYAGQKISDAVGEHDVFMIFSGTLVTSENSSLYSQNLPFAASFTSDNIASYSATPTTCGNGSSATFSLQVTNTNWTPSGDGIKQIQVQASSFNLVSALIPPTGWTPIVSSGTITWSAISSAYYVQPGHSLVFNWTGTAPIVHAGTEETFPSTATWNTSPNGILSQPITTGCYVG